MKAGLLACCPSEPALYRVAGVALWAGMSLWAWVFPHDMSLLTHILITALFAMSLDIMLGYAGILTVGHAAFFGVGAYTAGLLAVSGWGEPFTGLLAAAMVCGVLGWLQGVLLARGTDLSRLMITIAMCLLLTEAAVQFPRLTGGTDGLQGIVMWPLLGRFTFDLWGRTAFVYTFLVVLVLFLMLRSLVRSPFGLTLAGIRQNPQRMRALGVSVESGLRLACGVAAAIAGLAGALLAQTTQFVGVDVLSFERSAEILIILVLGGAGRLYGGLVGALLYGALHDSLSSISPQYWMLGVGLALIVVSLGGGGGAAGLAQRMTLWVCRRRRATLRP